MPEFYNGLKVIREGKYLSVYLPEHHLSSKKGTVYIHRLVAEEKLGRPLKRTESVHHIDENKHNYSPENLMVFKTRKDHLAFHQGDEIFLDGDVWVAKLKQYICPECGISIYKGSTLCWNCLTNKQREHIPSREDFLSFSCGKNFNQISKHYHVSWHTAKKWCLLHGVK